MKDRNMTNWHSLEVEKVLDNLKSNIKQGLEISEAQRRLEEYGPNQLTPKRQRGPLMRFILQFHQPLIYILIAAGVITALLQEWVDAGVIFGVVIVNAFIGFIQEIKAVKAIDALAKTMTTEATVIRSGQKTRVSSVDVVPGDIVLLQSGDKVPADMRLVSVKDLRVDESALTGESVPVDKKTDTLSEDTTVADRHNIVYASGLVTYGQATGVVFATGDRTEVGKISQLLSTTESLETPLTRNIARFSHVLLYAILGLAALTFAVGLLRGQSAFDMFMAAVALAVGAIPEGLPAALTITLAIGVARMARRRAIIRKLPAVETLGSTTVICSDKTGTLTENQMTVQKIYAGGQGYDVTGSGYEPEGNVLKDNEAIDIDNLKALRECLKAGFLCNDSQLLQREGRWTIQGDPTEGALLVVAHKVGIDTDTLNKEMPRLDSIPFESERQYMATMHGIGGQGKAVIYAKGSVESILERCNKYMDSEGRVVEIDHHAINKVVWDMGERGLRVLAFAMKEVESNGINFSHDSLGQDMVFLGLQGMIDPPRTEAIDAVEKCHRAGIKVKMITGDHAITASSIAGQIGLSNPTKVLTGRDLADISDDALVEVVEGTSVYARVSPEQKLRLVNALQVKGHVVAMTGDGVNDAPALKRADIGVAMGITGTDVAKEAADMVLTDDNFASIEAAVEEGRGVYDNLTKFIVWTLPTNLGEGLVILAAIFIGAVLPILPVQILWINMTTAVLLGLMLAFEPKEPDIMTRPPRDPKTPILTGVLVWRLFIVGFLLLAGSFGLFNLELARGASNEEARTVAVNVFVMVELFYLFNCRSLSKSFWSIGVFSNPLLFVGVGLMIILQLMFTYLPAMNTMFHSAPIGHDSWVRIIGVAFLSSSLVGFEKWLRNRVPWLRTA